MKKGNVGNSVRAARGANPFDHPLSLFTFCSPLFTFVHDKKNLAGEFPCFAAFNQSSESCLPKIGRFFADHPQAIRKLSAKFAAILRLKIETKNPMPRNEQLPNILRFQTQPLPLPHFASILNTLRTLLPVSTILDFRHSFVIRCLSSFVIFPFLSPARFENAFHQKIPELTKWRTALYVLSNWWLPQG